MSNELAPPGVALAALRCFSYEPNYETILGDLNEEFHQRLMQSGILAARLWYMRDAVRSILSMTCRELRQKPLRLIAFAAVVGCVLLMLLGPAVLQAQETNGGRWIGVGH